MQFDEIDNERLVAKDDLLSGVLLNHCLIYGNIGGDLGSTEPVETDGSKECAFFLCKISTTTVTPAYSKPISFGKVEKYLNTECQLSDDYILWIHVSNAIVMKKITDHFKLSYTLYKSFLDSTPMWRFQPMSDETFFLDIVTAQVLETHLNIRKTHCYCSKGLILTFENRMHAATEDGSVAPKDKATSSPLMRGISITSTADVMRDISGSSNANHVYALNGQTIIAGEFFDSLLKRLNEQSIQHKLIQNGSIQVVFEALSTNFLMLKPLLRFYCREMLELHNNVFVRKHKPSYTEGLKLKEDVDNFECCYKLVHSVVLGDTKSVLEKFKVYNAPKFATCIEEIGDIEFELLKIYGKIERLRGDLSRIDKNLEDLLKRRNDRIDLMLSVAATTFLPLSFLTGVFGMNFNNKKDSLLVFLFNSPHGSLSFWVLCVVLIFGLIYWYRKNDFFAILSAKEKNKHIHAFKNQNISRDKSSKHKADSAHSRISIDEDDFNYKFVQDGVGGSLHANMSSLAYSKQNLIGNRTIQSSSASNINSNSNSNSNTTDKV